MIYCCFEKMKIKKILLYLVLKIEKVIFAKNFNNNLNKKKVNLLNCKKIKNKNV